jgi:hypothetical protein
MSFVTDLINNELNKYYYDNIFVEGDLAIAISFFDDFYLFELLEEKDGVDVPINLSNLTEVNLVFFDDSKTVKIPRLKNATDIDPAQGQVMFRISEQDSATILGLTNNNFYITLVSGIGKEKDEVSVLKSKFYSLDEFNQLIITRQKLNIETVIAQRTTTLTEERNGLTASVGQLGQENITLSSSYNSLLSAYTDLEEKYRSAIGKLKKTPTTKASPFTPQNTVKVESGNTSVADLPVNQTDSASQLIKKSLKEKEQDLESNNQLAIIPSGPNPTGSTNSLVQESNPFANIV